MGGEESNEKAHCHEQAEVSTYPSDERWCWPDVMAWRVLVPKAEHLKSGPWTERHCNVSSGAYRRDQGTPYAVGRELSTNPITCSLGQLQLHDQQLSNVRSEMQLQHSETHDPCRAQSWRTGRDECVVSCPAASSATNQSWVLLIMQAWELITYHTCCLRGVQFDARTGHRPQSSRHQKAHVCNEAAPKPQFCL